MFEFENFLLGSKYASSKNYYFTKEINDIIEGYRGSQIFAFKDDELFSRGEENLKRMYRKEEYSGKISMLVDYYR